MVQGRLMWTSGKTVFEGKPKTNFQTGLAELDKLGNPKIEYGFGLAVPKGTPEFQELWNLMHAEAFTIYPSGQLPPDFSMKFKDGDAIDHKGNKFADREGYAGHIILACTTMIPFKCFRHEAGNNIMIMEGIKCGDYVNVQVNIKAHPAVGQGKAGLYMNPSAVQLIQPGKEIINTPSGDQLFGQAAPTYAGQVIADTGAPAMQAMPQAAPQYAPAAPVPQAMPAAVPAPQAAPHHGVLPQQFQPAPQAAPVPQAMPQAAPVPQAMPQAALVPQAAPLPQAAPQYAPAPVPQMPMGNAAAPAAIPTGLMPAQQAPPQPTYAPPAQPSNMMPAAPQMPQ